MTADAVGGPSAGSWAGPISELPLSTKASHQKGRYYIRETEAKENQVDDSTSPFRVGGSKDYNDLI